MAGPLDARPDLGGELALEHRPRERRGCAVPVMPVTSVTSGTRSRAASIGAKSRA